VGKGKYMKENSFLCVFSCVVICGILVMDLAKWSGDWGE